MTGELGELGLDRHGNSPGFDLDLNRGLDLNLGRNRPGLRATRDTHERTGWSRRASTVLGEDFPTIPRTTRH